MTEVHCPPITKAQFQSLAALYGKPVWFKGEIFNLRSYVGRFNIAEKKFYGVLQFDPVADVGEPVDIDPIIYPTGEPAVLPAEAALGDDDE